MEIGLALGIAAPLTRFDDGGLPGGGGVEPPPPASLAARRMTDAAWSWHQQRSVLHDPARGRVYAGLTSLQAATGTPGTQWIGEFDAATGAALARHAVGSGYVADDHIAPALWIRDGRLICALAGHNDAAEVKLAWAAGTDPAGLGPFTVKDGLSGLTTYAQFFETGGALHLATRVGVSEWRVWRNTAGGDPAAWGSSASLVTSAGQTYMAARGLSDRLAMVLWDHPTLAGASRGLIRIAERADPMAGSVAQETAAVLYTPPAGGSSRVLSVDAGATQILYATFTVGAEPAAYRLARLSGTDRTDPAHWTHEDLGITTQRAFWADSEYVAGGDLAPATGQGSALWLGWCTPDIWHDRLEYWSRPDPASGWTRQVVAEADRQMVRPLAVPGPAGPMALVQTLYGYTDYRGWEIDALCLPLPAAQDFYPNQRWTGAAERRDDFAAPDGTALAGRTAVTGGAWTVLAGTPALTAARARRGGTGVELARLGADLGVDQRVAGLVHCASSSGSAFLLGRVAASGQDFVQFGLSDSGASGRGVYLHEMVAGAAQQRGFWAVASVAANEKLRLVLEIEGTVARGYVNDVLRITASLGTVAAAGGAGIRFTGGGTTTGFHIDEFGARSLPAPG
ncbi:hypothetical protein V8J36_18645 [Frigidibacter sp. MR17.14]|uniref:hypothetical protein n=1 Tax=Frigidibacter sp. MR17.14 TaxID=3126509 RepID=UPI0030129E30